MLIGEAINKANKWRKELDELGDSEIIALTDTETIKQFLDLSLWALKKASAEDD